MDSAKKEIVFVGPAYPYRGGIASFNEMLATELQLQGHSIKICTFTLQYPSFMFPGKSQFSDKSAPKNLNISRDVNSINPLNWLRVGLKLKKVSPDILFVRYWSPYLAPALGVISRLVRSNGHTQVVSLSDNIIPHEHHFYDKFLTRFFIGSVDRFICMSHEVELDLIKLSPKKPYSFAPHPIYSNYGAAKGHLEACLNLGLDPQKSYALFFGLIRDYKGLDILLDSWAKYKTTPQSKDKILIVAGEYYTPKEPYLKQIEQLSITDSVIIVDKFIPDDQVADYFSACSVLVQPYKSATQSGVTQIAYHFNTPMIVTPVGGLPEIVPHNRVGYVSEPKDLPKYLEQIFDPNINSVFVENIKTEKQRFSWSGMAEKVLGDL